MWVWWGVLSLNISWNIWQNIPEKNEHFYKEQLWHYKMEGLRFVVWSSEMKMKLIDYSCKTLISKTIYMKSNIWYGFEWLLWIIVCGNMIDWTLSILVFKSYTQRFSKNPLKNHNNKRRQITWKIKAKTVFASFSKTSKGTQKDATFEKKIPFVFFCKLISLISSRFSNQLWWRKTAQK